jgi:hypothetical protein
MRSVWAAVLLTLTVCLLIGSGSALAQASSTTQQLTIPIEDLFPGGILPDEYGCFGEPVQLTGSIHVIIHMTEDGNDGFHFAYRDNPQGISGLGLISGARYQGTGGEKFSFNAKSLPYEETYVSNFRIIGTGKAGTLLFHENAHITINGTGHITVNFDKLTQNDECR